MTEHKKVDRAGAGAAETSHIAAAPAPARRRRQTEAHKQEAVLRVLRGEDIELVARGIDAMAADVSGWRDVFLETGAYGLKHRPRDVRDEEIDRLRARVGEVTMDNELLVEKIAKMEAGPLSGARGRSDERRPLDLHGQDLWCITGVPGQGSEPGQRVPGRATGPGRALAAPPPGSCRAVRPRPC